MRTLVGDTTKIHQISWKIRYLEVGLHNLGSEKRFCGVGDDFGGCGGTWENNVVYGAVTYIAILSETT